MRLPGYYLVDEVPVKAVRAADGGIEVLAFDAGKGELVLEMGYLSDILVSGSRDVRRLTEEQFEAALERAGAKG